MTKEGLVYEKAIAVMADMEALGKDRRNAQQGYNFRGIDDVYNLVQPIMAKHGLIMRSEILEDRSEERASKSGGTLIYRIMKIVYCLVAKDGSELCTMVIGEGMDSGDKAANKAMSVAQKYAILQMFMIPTEEPKDPEVDSPKPARKAAPKAAAPTKDAGHVTKPAGQPSPAVPMTDAQAEALLTGIAALQELTKRDDATMSKAIREAIGKRYGIEIKGVSDLNKAQAEYLIATLKKWIDAYGKKKADEIAAMVAGGGKAA